MAFDSYEFRSNGSTRSNQHAEAMERLDNGDRLAMAAIRHALGTGESRPEISDAEAVKRTGSDLLDIRATLITAAGRFSQAGNEDLHQWFNALLNGVDALGAELGERSS